MSAGLTVVLGPADLQTTALVDALRGQGIEVLRAVEPSCTMHSVPPGIAIVDVSARPGAMEVVSAAIAAGWRLVVLADDCASPRVAAAVAQGASAWLSTKAPFASLADAVRRLGSSDSLISDEDRATWSGMHERNLAAATERVELLDRLSDREFGVLQSLERGLRAAEIAKLNVVSIATVRTQIRSVLRKLRVTSQGAAVELYRAALRFREDL